MSLKSNVEAEFGCPATLIESRSVTCELWGEPETRYVETFRLTGHATTKLVYAWRALGDGSRNEPKITIVSRSELIRSPEEAIQRAFEKILKEF